MFTVMGVTGQVGGAVARNLLASGHKVRAVVRDVRKAAEWHERGCELAAADINDAGALTQAFQDTQGAFVMLPSLFDPEPGFPEAGRLIANLHDALQAARPELVVALSTIGAQVETTNLLTQLHNMETVLGTLPIPITFLRPAWFMENASWDVTPARETGIIPSYLQPLDKLFHMIATRDIGQVGAEVLCEPWQGTRVVELEGPGRISPNDIARTFAGLLQRDVRMQAVPRETWEPVFRSQGMKNPLPRMQMLDGFNQGWIEFENGESGSRKTTTGVKEVLQSLVQGS